MLMMYDTALNTSSTLCSPGQCVLNESLQPEIKLGRDLVLVFLFEGLRGIKIRLSVTVIYRECSNWGRIWKGKGV